MTVFIHKKIAKFMLTNCSYKYKYKQSIIKINLSLSHQIEDWFTKMYD